MSTNTKQDSAGTTFVGYIIGLFLVGLIVMLAWNLGVVAIVAACGGSIAKIGYFTALFAFVAYLILTAPLRSRNRS